MAASEADHLSPTRSMKSVTPVTPKLGGSPMFAPSFRGIGMVGHSSSQKPLHPVPPVIEAPPGLPEFAEFQQMRCCRVVQKITTRDKSQRRVLVIHNMEMYICEVKNHKVRREVHVGEIANICRQRVGGKGVVRDLFVMDSKSEPSILIEQRPDKANANHDVDEVLNVLNGCRLYIGKPELKVEVIASSAGLKGLREKGSFEKGVSYQTPDSKMRRRRFEEAEARTFVPKRMSLSMGGNDLTPLTLSSLGPDLQPHLAPVFKDAECKVYFIQKVIKYGHGLTFSNSKRLIIITHEALWQLTPPEPGSVLKDKVNRCVPLAQISEVRTHAHQIAIVVPVQYDLLIEVPDLACLMDFTKVVQSLNPAVRRADTPEHRVGLRLSKKWADKQWRQPVFVPPLRLPPKPVVVSPSPSSRQPSMQNDDIEKLLPYHSISRRPSSPGVVYKSTSPYGSNHQIPIPPPTEERRRESFAPPLAAVEQDSQSEDSESVVSSELYTDTSDDDDDDDDDDCSEEEEEEEEDEEDTPQPPPVVVPMMAVSPQPGDGSNPKLGLSVMELPPADERDSPQQPVSHLTPSPFMVPVTTQNEPEPSLEQHGYPSPGIAPPSIGSPSLRGSTASHHIPPVANVQVSPDEVRGIITSFYQSRNKLFTRRLAQVEKIMQHHKGQEAALLRNFQIKYSDFDFYSAILRQGGRRGLASVADHAEDCLKPPPAAIPRKPNPQEEKLTLHDRVHTAPSPSPPLPPPAEQQVAAVVVTEPLPLPPQSEIPQLSTEPPPPSQPPHDEAVIEGLAEKLVKLDEKFTEMFEKVIGKEKETEKETEVVQEKEEEEQQQQQQQQEHVEVPSIVVDKGSEGSEEEDAENRIVELNFEMKRLQSQIKTLTDENNEWALKHHKMEELVKPKEVKCSSTQYGAEEDHSGASLPRVRRVSLSSPQLNTDTAEAARRYGSTPRLVAQDSTASPLVSVSTDSEPDRAPQPSRQRYSVGNTPRPAMTTEPPLGSVTPRRDQSPKPLLYGQQPSGRRLLDSPPVGVIEEGVKEKPRNVVGEIVDPRRIQNLRTALLELASRQVTSPVTTVETDERPPPTRDVMSPITPEKAGFVGLPPPPPPSLTSPGLVRGKGVEEKTHTPRILTPAAAVQMTSPVFEGGGGGVGIEEEPTTPPPAPRGVPNPHYYRSPSDVSSVSTASTAVQELLIGHHALVVTEDGVHSQAKTLTKFFTRRGFTVETCEAKRYASKASKLLSTKVQMGDTLVIAYLGGYKDRVGVHGMLSKVPQHCTVVVVVDSPGWGAGGAGMPYTLKYKGDVVGEGGSLQQGAVLFAVTPVYSDPARIGVFTSAFVGSLNKRPSPAPINKVIKDVVGATRHHLIVGCTHPFTPETPLPLSPSDLASRATSSCAPSTLLPRHTMDWDRVSGITPAKRNK